MGNLVRRTAVFIQWALEDAAPGEPIVVVAEPVDAVLLGKLGLRSTGLGKAEIVKSEVGRYMRLIVTLEQRRRPSAPGHSVKPLPHHLSFSGMG